MEEQNMGGNMEEQKPVEKSSSNIWVVAIVIIVLLGLGFVFLGGNTAEAPTNEDDTEETMEETGNSTPTQPTPSNPSTSSGGNTTNELPPADNLTVSYTSEGFVPFLLEINAGDTVRFVNNTATTMWVTSADHPTAKDQYYPEFGMSKSIGTGGVYEFQFTLEGTWGYKNLNNEKHLGAIVVKPQKQQ